MHRNLAEMEVSRLVDSSPEEPVLVAAAAVAAAAVAAAAVAAAAVRLPAVAGRGIRACPCCQMRW